jgi:hypothetical protein
MSCLFGDFNVYGSPLSNNIRLSLSITPTDLIVQVELHLRNCVGNLNADPLHIDYRFTSLYKTFCKQLFLMPET